MKSKELSEILRVEPDAEVKVQQQLDWPWCGIQSTGMGQDENGNKYVLLRTYDLDASIATRDSRDPSPEPIALLKPAQPPVDNEHVAEGCERFAQ